MLVCWCRNFGQFFLLGISSLVGFRWVSLVFSVLLVFILLIRKWLLVRLVQVRLQFCFVCDSVISRVLWCLFSSVLLVMVLGVMMCIILCLIRFLVSVGLLICLQIVIDLFSVISCVRQFLQVCIGILVIGIGVLLELLCWVRVMLSRCVVLCVLLQNSLQKLFMWKNSSRFGYLDLVVKNCFMRGVCFVFVFDVDGFVFELVVCKRIFYGLQ